MRRKLTDAMQYPIFVLIAAACVMLFFILFVLPQFSSVLQDFGAKSDTALSAFISLSDFLRANATAALLDLCGDGGRYLVAVAPARHRRVGHERDLPRSPASPASFCSTAPACSAAISASCWAAAST